MRHSLRRIALAGLFLTGFVASAAAKQQLQAPGGGDVRALVIGVNVYYRLPSAQLRGAVADATDIAQALAKVGVETKPILDREATRTRVVAALNQLVAEANRGDLVIISFAGHGMKVPEYKRFKGIEAGGVNEQIAFSGFAFEGPGSGEVLVNKELKAYLSRLDAKGVDVIVAMDSCFGGGMTRRIDARGEMTMRGMNGAVDRRDLGKFAPIEMNEAEARANVREMTHVIFFSGASEDTKIPEINDLDGAQGARGALSYYFARAIEGAASQGSDASFDALLRYLRQNVREHSHEMQELAFEPRTNDPKTLQRSLLHFGEPVPPPAPPSSQTQSRLQNPIRLAAIGGAPNAISFAARGLAPFAPAASAQDADLVWDVGAKEALENGDMLMRGVDASLIGAVVDRTWAIRAIRRLSEQRALQIGLAEGGKLYVPGEHPRLEAVGLAGAYLIVFNIAADGELQMLYPTAARTARLDEDTWTQWPNVTPPFGADHVVAVASAQEPEQLVAWLVEHNHHRDAALAPAELARLIGADPNAKIGAVDIFTAQSRDQP